MRFRMHTLWKYPISSQLAALRMIRKSNGVGRPPAHTLKRLARLGWFAVYSADDPHCRWRRQAWSQRTGPAARRRARRLAELPHFSLHHYPTEAAE
jgi:hypothetical protein